MSKAVFILGGKRTPMGEYVGALKDVSAIDLGRHVALKAGIPFARPALTVNRLCGSGIQSIVSDAQMIQLGEARTCLVGGMESMSQAPHVIRGARSGFALGQGKLEDSLNDAVGNTNS